MLIWRRRARSVLVCRISHAQWFTEVLLVGAGAGVRRRRHAQWFTDVRLIGASAGVRLLRGRSQSPYSEGGTVLIPGTLRARGLVIPPFLTWARRRVQAIHSAGHASTIRVVPVPPSFPGKTKKGRGNILDDGARVRSSRCDYQCGRALSRKGTAHTSTVRVRLPFVIPSVRPKRLCSGDTGSAEAEPSPHSRLYRSFLLARACVAAATRRRSHPTPAEVHAFERRAGGRVEL